MHSIRTAAAEEYFLLNNNYGTAGTAGVCTGGTAGSMWQDVATNMANLSSSTVTLAGGATNVDCGAGSSAWAMASKLPSGSYWCIDSNGAARGSASTTGVAYNTLVGAGGAKTVSGNTACN
jgi:hypothetical protein